MQKYKYFFKVAYFLTSFLYNNLWGKYYVRFDVKSLAVLAICRNFAPGCLIDIKSNSYGYIEKS